MGAFSRGFRNVYRSKARAALLVAILGLSLAVSIAMLQASATIGAHARTVA